MSSFILQTNQLTKIYRQQRVVDQINLRIKEGEIYGFIGLNGAGKSTFMRMIAGLTEPSSGQYTLFGQANPREVHRSRHRIGTLIEEPALFPHMTARQNLETIRLQRGIPGKDCIERTLHQVNLANTKNKKVKDFSLGMRQRLGIAMALLSDPEFLILDEPINGLDPMGVVEIRELLQQLNENHGVTILISSHILSEVHQLATYYGVIHDGKLIEQLSAKQLEEKCGSYLLLKVSEPEKATVILERALKTTVFEVLPDRSIKLYSHVDQPIYISKLLTKHDIHIEQLSPHHDTLEDYFKRLVQGASV